MMDARPDLACEIPTRELEAFAAGAAHGAARRQVLEHLLAGCDRCRSHLASHGYGSHRSATPADDDAMTRILSRVREASSFFDQERARAAGLIEPFLRHPTSRQWTLIRNSHRYDIWSFASRLLEAAYVAVYDDPRRTLALSQMALEIAGRLDEKTYGKRLVTDLCARARAFCGNAHRALGDLRQAAQELADARELLPDGSGDPLAEAELLYFEASWRRAMRDFPSALRAARRSAAIYRRLGDDHLEGRSINNEAVILGLAGEAQRSKTQFESALAKIDGERDPHLALGVRHNLVWRLVEDGCFAEAAANLAGFRHEYARQGNRSALARLDWLHARIIEKSGELEASETAFRAAIDAFGELELPYEAAMAALDLAGLYADSSRWHDLRVLVTDTLVLFRALGVAREEIAAWIVLQQAAEAEAVTAALIRRLSGYFSAAKLSPGSPFDA